MTPARRGQSEHVAFHVNIYRVRVYPGRVANIPAGPGPRTLAFPGDDEDDDEGDDAEEEAEDGEQERTVTLGLGDQTAEDSGDDAADEDEDALDQPGRAARRGEAP